MASLNTKLKLRSSQIMTPYGVGSIIEIDGQSFFVRGTNKWPQETPLYNPSFKSYTKYRNLEEINFPLFTKRIPNINSLKRPRFTVPIIRFPKWHFCPNCRTMTKLSPKFDFQVSDNDNKEKKLPIPTCKNPECKNKQLAPMRFIAVCKNGHIDDIDWWKVAHRPSLRSKVGRCEGGDLKFITKKGAGGDFSNMHIVCMGCSSKIGPCHENSMDSLNEILGQKCEGNIPGESKNKKLCHDKDDKQIYMEMQPRGAQSLHYPIILSALDISLDQSPNQKIICIREHKDFERAQLFWSKDFPEEDRKEFIDPLVNDICEDCSDFNVSRDDVYSEIIKNEDTEPAPLSGQEITQAEIMDMEFPILSSNNKINTKNFVSLPNILSEKPLSYYFTKISQIEKLREVRVFKGFQRLDFGVNSISINPDFDIEPKMRWLPAQEVFGEGIFFEFNISSLNDWESNNKDTLGQFTSEQITKANDKGLLDKSGIIPSPRFIMLHTFAHLLINQLSFDCGYSSSSLKERIYSDTMKEDYGGILIYTSDADTQGAMGGLVEMGQENLIEDVICKAIARSTWCSNDPVCRELKSQGVSGLNTSACHACSLVAETSCSHNNILLNRLLVSGDGRKNGNSDKEPVGFFDKLIN